MDDTKTSLPLVDPELAGVLDYLQGPPPSDETLAELRALDFQLPQGEDDSVTIERRVIPGPAGAPDLSVVIYRPAGLPSGAPVLLHIHGGGYVMGNPDQYVFYGRGYAAACECVVVSTSYRLAPETRWPGAVEDVYAALCWVHDHADELGVDPGRVAIAGESAGGGHAAALTLYARDRGGPPILFQLLTFPMLDDRPSTNPFSGQYGWTRAHNHYGWSSLLGVPAGSDAVPAEAVPARARDLSGLPPAYIATGALDLFADENIEYARRLNAAGVPVGLHVIPGAYHGFDIIVPDAQPSKLLRAGVHDALRTAFRRAAQTARAPLSTE